MTAQYPLLPGRQSRIRRADCYSGGHLRGAWTQRIDSFAQQGFPDDQLCPRGAMHPVAIGATHRALRHQVRNPQRTDGRVGTGDWSSGSRRSVTCSAARGIAVRHTGNGTSARAADAGPQTRASPSGMGLPGPTTRHCGRLIRGMTRAAIRCQRCCPSSAAKQMSQKVNNSPSTSGATATTSISPKRTCSFGPR